MRRPDDTPWEDGTFKLTLEFNEEYPNKAPKVKFVSKMFHPNVYADGSICLDILQNQVRPLVRLIRSLFDARRGRGRLVASARGGRIGRISADGG